jgi:hypothetical protein
VEGKDRKIVLTGSLILIALGVLISLNSTGIYGFNDSWPILLVVISVGLLVQRIQDIGGWFIGLVGIIFLAMKNFYPRFEQWAQYVFPAVMIIFGFFLLYDQFKTSKKKSRTP